MTLDERLDVIDRLLMGCVSRGERLAIVAELEGRLRGIWSSARAETPTMDMAFHAGTPGFGAAQDPFSPPQRPGTRARRSKLAVMSGLLGIAAGALLFGTPIAYLLATVLDQAFNEGVAIIVLVGYLAMILLAGSGAIASGIAALWRLRKHRPEIIGRGWAVAGLCTGPVPLALASVMALYFGLEIASSYGGSTQTASCPAPAVDITPPTPYVELPAAAPAQLVNHPYASDSPRALPVPLPSTPPGTLPTQPNAASPIPVEPELPSATPPSQPPAAIPSPAPSPEPATQPQTTAEGPSAGLVE